jgi:crotonobetainyl-CoA:carnitine CoA-transferase CaiB-like acyl-CoA transferase
MLSPYRVLDLTDDRGELAAMILGDLGADVIRVEPPGGSEARRRGPRMNAKEAVPGTDPEGSLQFFAYNRNKRSIVIDLAQSQGRDEFLELVATADFVIESSPGGTLQKAGIDFETLRAVQPRIVHMQITPYGADGPRANWAASDLTIAAMGGPVSLQGVPERAPVRVSVPQVWRHTGAEAAVAALVAHARMGRTGEAQFVDVSAQSAMTWTMLNGMGASAIQGHDFQRMGSLLQLGSSSFPLVFESTDGHVVIIPNGELLGVLLDWMLADGIGEASWKQMDWNTYEMLLLTGQEVPIQFDELIDTFRRFMKLHTKRELFERGLEIGATIAPVNTIADLLSFPQLASREFWRKVELPDGSQCETPGPFARSTRGPLAITRWAPTLDQHGEEIRLELREGGRAPAEAPNAKPDGALPFAGLKIADFSWIGVGPISAKYFADHGADVIRIESTTQPDKLRMVAPFKDQMGIDQSHFFADFNASKRSLTLNLKKPAAVEVAKRLIGWSDIVFESFTPGALARLGLGYDVAKEIRPDIIMLSTCLMGQTGPAASMAGYGYHAGAVAGFYELTGWPDLAPAGPWMAYTDTIAPRFVAATVMAALDHRNRTGEGQHIDGAQFEMGLQFLAPELLDFQRNGRLATRNGNVASDAAPHGVYPCTGDDQWCAIAVLDDTQWTALRRAMGDPAWSRDKDFDTTAGRLARRVKLDEKLALWTQGRSASETLEQLIKVDVPAGIVQRSSDLLRDPQYAQRNFYREHEHPVIGNSPYAGHQFRIKGYDSGPRFAAPTIGQHSFEVLAEVLGIGDEEIAELFAEGAIE